MAAKDYEEFNPRLERLVVEIRTEWPASAADVSRAARVRLAKLMHADPAVCQSVRYDRMHTGFCRVISVTDDDLVRLNVRPRAELATTAESAD